jgi:hypothetical protein
MKTKKKKRKKIGTSLVQSTSLMLIASLVLLAAALLPAAAAAKKKPALDVYAVISGSVFQESGFALPDADITLVAESPSGASGKAEKMEAVSDARGEFVVRVPPGPAHYTVVVAAKGYQSLRKSVAVEGQERVEVTFQLDRESK